MTHGSGILALGSNYPFPDKSSIWSSADGQAWKAVAENLAGVLSEVEHGNGRYVAVGYGGVITQSADGKAWTPATVPGARRNLYSVAYGGGLFVVVGSNGTLLTSPDGVAWISRTTDTTIHLHSVIHNGRQFVAIGAPKSLCHSVDGIT